MRLVSSVETFLEQPRRGASFEAADLEGADAWLALELGQPAAPAFDVAAPSFGLAAGR